MTSEQKEEIKQFIKITDEENDAYVESETYVNHCNLLLAALEEAEKETKHWKQVQKDYQNYHEAICTRLRKTDEQLEKARQQAEDSKKPFYADRQYLWMEKQKNDAQQKLIEAQQTIEGLRNIFKLINSLSHIDELAYSAIKTYVNLGLGERNKES